MAIIHFNRNFSENSSASENENIKQIDITCEDKPEENFQNERNVAENIYDTEYEYLGHNLIDNTMTVLNDDIESHDENLHNEVKAVRTDKNSETICGEMMFLENSSGEVYDESELTRDIYDTSSAQLITY